MFYLSRPVVCPHCFRIFPEHRLPYVCVNELPARAEQEAPCSSAIPYYSNDAAVIALYRRRHRVDLSGLWRLEKVLSTHCDLQLAAELQVLCSVRYRLSLIRLSLWIAMQAGPTLPDNGDLEALPA